MLDCKVQNRTGVQKKITRTQVRDAQTQVVKIRVQYSNTQLSKAYILYNDNYSVSSLT